MDTQIVIVGAGVIGLAIAKTISSTFDNVYVIEKNKTFGQETSSRNSEVIHSGIYYPEYSLKAQLCVEGKQLLYDYCVKKGIPHKKIGKLIIANNPEEEKILDSLKQQSLKNGVDEFYFLNSNEIKDIEPHICASAALFFPTTGIIDSYSLMKQLETDAINQGVTFVYNSEVTSINKINQGYKITIKDAGGYFDFSTKIIINTAGLFADNIASMIGMNNSTYIQYYWKGEYFSVINGKNKYLQHLVYPVPHKHQVGLGIHATLDLNNRLRLGPNAFFLENKTIDYTVNPDHRFDFYNAAHSYLPFLELNDLVPDQAGIRPKLQKPGDTFRDFIIRNEKDIGFPGFINLIGIESPGLTSCLAIGNKVLEILTNILCQN